MSLKLKYVDPQHVSLKSPPLRRRANIQQLLQEVLAIGHLSERAKAFGPSPCLLAKSEVEKRRAANLPVYDFGLGEAKGGISKDLQEAGIEAFRSGRTGYVDAQGILELREGIIDWLNYRDHYNAENVLVSVGAKQALAIAITAITNPGDSVLFDSAPWVSYLPMTIAAGANPIRVTPSNPERDFLKISAADLEAAIKCTPNAKAFLVNSPCNPTGQLYSTEELDELATVCAHHKIYFILDRLYWKSIYDGQTFPEPTLTDLVKPFFITLDGLSKNWRSVGGLRVGWAVGPKRLIEAMSRIQSHATSGTCAVSQQVALAAVTNEYNEEMKEDLESKRDLVNQLVQDLPHVKPFPSPASFYSFWDIRGTFGKSSPTGEMIQTSDDLTNYLLRETGAVVLSGQAFEQDGYLRLCFHIPKDEIIDGFKAMKTALSALS